MLTTLFLCPIIIIQKPLGPICDVAGDDAPKKKIIFDEGDGESILTDP